MAFQDKLVVITGGAGGIARATAPLLLAEGASLLLIDPDGAALERTAGPARGRRSRAHGTLGARYARCLRRGARGSRPADLRPRPPRRDLPGRRPGRPPSPALGRGHGGQSHQRLRHRGRLPAAARSGPDHADGVRELACLPAWLLRPHCLHGGQGRDRRPGARARPWPRAQGPGQRPGARDHPDRHARSHHRGARAARAPARGDHAQALRRAARGRDRDPLSPERRFRASSPAR